MRAMVLPRFGGPELFEERELEPEPLRHGEVRVRVVAASVNPIDAKIRATGAWSGLQPPLVLGYDAAGVVEEVGPGVDDLARGDEVYYSPEVAGRPRGTYAEQHVVPAALVAKKPAALSFEEAAAVPLAGGTAWDAIVRRLALRPGETVLIHGGAGGVGTFAVQFARACGARVLATAGAANQRTLRECGADVAIDYAKQDAAEVALAETGGAGVDAAFDIQGPDLVARCLPAVRPGGRIACILPPRGDLTLLYRRNITLHGVFLTKERARLRQMGALLDRGLVRPVIGEVLPLREVARAHARIESGHGRGKIVLRIAG